MAKSDDIVTRIVSAHEDAKLGSDSFWRQVIAEAVMRLFEREAAITAQSLIDDIKSNSNRLSVIEGDKSLEGAIDRLQKFVT